VTRLRKPKLKDGELRMYWGKLPHENPDMVFSWQGDASMSRDSRLLHYRLASQRPTVTCDKVNWGAMEPSLIEELESRGYDITTLKFSIMKKVKP